LLIEMNQVPKILKPLVDEWTRDGFIVSFKVRYMNTSCVSSLMRSTSLFIQLETDPTLLIPKARAALERYGHHLVIGNDLHRRKYEVVFVSRDHRGSASSDVSVNWLRISADAVDSRGHPKEIEEDIVAELTKRHQAWIDGPQPLPPG